MASGTAIQEHGSRRSNLVQRLLRAIFAGELEPGQRLRLERLAARFELSVTPVREALVELAGIGLVELQPNRGAVLLPFGRKELGEILQVRRILECEAARSACGRIPSDTLRQLEQRFKQMETAPRGSDWSHRTRELDTELHELIASSCGNGRLAYEINRYTVIYRTLRDARHEHRNARANYEEMNENSEHLLIVQAMIEGDADKASQAMAAHVNQAGYVLLQDVFPHELDDEPDPAP
ncbi:MAG: GntR family transcriptional regulator [Pirellulaceae bacterium]